MTTITKRVADTGVSGISADKLFLQDGASYLQFDGDMQTGTDVLFLAMSTSQKFYNSIITKRISDTGENRLTL